MSAWAAAGLDIKGAQHESPVLRHIRMIAVLKAARHVMCGAHETPSPERRMSNVPLSIALAAASFLLAACSESTAPRPQPSTRPLAAMTRPDNPPPTMTDGEQCWSWDDMQTWSCAYVGQATYYYDFDFSSGDYEYVSPTDCSLYDYDCPSSEPMSSGGDYGIPAPEPTTDDNAFVPLPTCDPLPSDRDSRAWCEGMVPSGFRIMRIQDALSAMGNIGGICATLAALGDSLVSNDRIRLFNRSGDSTLVMAGVAPLGGGGSGPEAWMALSINFTDLYYDQDHTTTHEPVRRDLQELLAHELDHLHGTTPVHADQAGYTTPNSETCGGVQ